MSNEAKKPLTASDASRIQAHANKSGQNQGFKARAQRAAAKQAGGHSGKNASGKGKKSAGVDRGRRTPIRLPRLAAEEAMRPCRTASSADGLCLLHAPTVPGAIADALRLKLASDPRYKSAQRYLKGQRVKPEMVDVVMRALVDAAVPGGVALPDCAEDG